MPSDDTFKGNTNYGDATPTLQLENGLAAFIDWALLNIGAFYNNTRPQSGVYGGDFSRLRLQNEPNFTLGRVWQGVRTNWVYESGLSYATQPINISGVYVNNTFYSSSSSGSFSHKIDYPNGRVIFDSPISTSSVVQVNHSYKAVNVQTSSSSPWYQELMYGSYRPDSTQFTTIISSGDWSIVGSNRLQLPAIVVDSIPYRRFTGYELGGGQNMYQGMALKVFTENKNTRDMLVDILSDQNDKTINLYDINKISVVNDFPLDYLGGKNSGCKTFPQLAASYYGFRVTLEDTKLTRTDELSTFLFLGEVTTTLWVIRPDI